MRIKNQTSRMHTDEEEETENIRGGGEGVAGRRERINRYKRHNNN
jgi:hypothetical protein